jgi:NTE family protein
LILQVDVFSGAGALPTNLSDVQERCKDIQYASKTRFNTTRISEIEALRNSLRRVLDKLPDSFQTDPDVQKLDAISTRGAVALVHFINRHNTRSSNFKDYEFSRATVMELWDFGYRDAHKSLSDPRWREATDLGNGVNVYDLTG